MTKSVAVDSRAVLDYCLESGHTLRITADHFGIALSQVKRCITEEANGMLVCQVGFHTFKPPSDKRGRWTWICPDCLAEKRKLPPPELKAKRGRKPGAAKAAKPEVPAAPQVPATMPDRPKPSDDGSIGAMELVVRALQPLQVEARRRVMSAVGILLGE
ncbi:MAG: hypothetical protein WC683_04735 [bacterium]